MNQTIATRSPPYNIPPPTAPLSHPWPNSNPPPCPHLPPQKFPGTTRETLVMNNKNANLFSFFSSLIPTNKPTRINIHTSCNEVRGRGAGGGAKG